MIYELINSSTFGMNTYMSTFTATKINLFYDLLRQVWNNAEQKHQYNSFLLHSKVLDYYDLHDYMTTHVEWKHRA